MAKRSTRTTLVDEDGNLINAANPLDVVTGPPGGLEVVQPTHGDLNVNANVQYENADVTIERPLPVDTGLVFDAFGRQRVTQPRTIFDSKQIFDNQPMFWDETTGLADITSAHSVLTASTVISYDAGATGGTFTRQTFMRFNYQPGKSQLVMMTGILIKTGAATTRIGYFDDDNGLFFESVASVTGVVLRSGVSGSTVDTRVVQANWNLDVMDGSGVSGITLDWSKTQIFVIDFEWLGVGTARMGVFAHGEIHYVHQFRNANVLTVVYMSTPNLPCRFQLVAAGSTSASSMECICTTAVSEGGMDVDQGILRYKSTGGTHIDCNTANFIYAIAGIRLKTTALGATILLEEMSMINATNDDFEWMVILNAVLGTPMTFADETNSNVQTGVGEGSNPSLTTISSGTSLFGGFVKASASTGSVTRVVQNSIRLGAAIDGTRDEIYLAVRPLSANADIDGSITWREM